MFLSGLLLVGDVLSQTEDSYYKNHISLYTFQGVVLPHYEFIYANVNSTVSSIDLNYSTKLAGDSTWDRIYNRPELGIKVLFTTLGNNEVFGLGYSLVPNFTFNLLTKKKFACFSKVGVGIGYVTKKFSSEDNIKNIAIGSHFNIHFDYQLGVSYNIVDRFRLSGGVFFGHYSNANTSAVNLGLNYASSFVGLDYVFKKTQNTFNYGDKNKLPKEGNFLVYAGLGLRNKDFLTTPSNFSFFFRENISDKYMLGGGIDLYYDPFIEMEIKGMQVQSDHWNWDNFNAGIFFNQSVRYRTFYLSLSQGVYIIDNKIKGWSYFKAAFEYNFLEKYFAKIAVKSHLFRADYPEIGVGYKW